MPSVHKEKQSSRCLNDDCSDKTLYRVAARCEYEHALNKIHGCLTYGIRFYFGVNPPFCEYAVSKMEYFLEFACCLFGDGQVCQLRQQFFLVLV